MNIKSLAAMSVIAALAAAPAFAGKYGDAVVQQPVEEPVVVVPHSSSLGLGALGTGGAVAAGVVGLVVVGTLLGSDDPAPATTTTE